MGRTKSAQAGHSGTSFLKDWKYKAGGTVGLPRWRHLRDAEVMLFFLKKAFISPAPSQQCIFYNPPPPTLGAGERLKRQSSAASRIYNFIRISCSLNCLATVAQVCEEGNWILEILKYFSPGLIAITMKNRQEHRLWLKNRKIQRSQKPPRLGAWIKCVKSNHTKLPPFLSQKWLNIGHFI